MASQTISYAEVFQKVYEAFNQINFTAFDYYSIKQALVEYMKVYFPESFNDFIESSEFIMLVETFAYIGEQLIYRVDVGSHENFITVAQRKQSVLRLAKLISYKATRNLPARGTLKITSVQTTQVVYDSRGNALNGTTINWNDINNNLWFEQFITVMNAASSSNYGTVTPSDRVQVDNVLYELYSLNNRYTTNGVLPFNVSVNGTNYNMEAVSSALTANGPTEARPSYNSAFSYLYGTDGFGYDSAGTGFFVLAKQGSLSSRRTTFDGITPNQTYDVTVNNINDIDVWLNNVDPDTDAILNNGNIGQQLSGQWLEVDTTTAQNVIFSYSQNRNRYEIETLENDQLRLAFGDGTFCNIPSGTFDIWYRVSANADFSIPQNAITDQTFTISYIDSTGNVQTLQFTASLTTNVTNASASETIDHIRQNAPNVYYTQNRMATGADYNLFFGQDPTVLKAMTMNRTFVGDSKYSWWYDASGAYENVKIFGNDMIVLFEDTTENQTIPGTVSTATLFTNYIVPILSSGAMYNYMVVNKVLTPRRSFTTTEQTKITNMLASNSWPDPVYLYYYPDQDVWKSTTVLSGTPYITITATMSGTTVHTWLLSYIGYNLVVQSPTTKFWDANDDSLISYETLSPTRDQIVLLQANINNQGTGLLSGNLELLVNGIYIDTNGLPDITKLNVTSYDAITSNNSGQSIVTQLIDPSWSFSVPEEAPYVLTLPFNYVVGVDEVDVTGILNSFWKEDPNTPIGGVSNTIVLNALTTGPITVYHNSWVYYNRTDPNQAWSYVTYSTGVAESYALQFLGNTPASTALYMRERGVPKLNFLWMHQTPDYYLVNPSKTNIQDVYLIQKGYYQEFQQWLAGTASEPTPPTPLQLRNDYSGLLVNAMISDTVVMHSGKLKPIIGSNAIPELQAQLVVVQNPNSTLTESQVQLNIVNIVQDYFDINGWDYGETFYFTQLVATIHQQMPADISTVVLVPLYPENYFGDMFQVNMDVDEIVQVDIGIEDIVIVQNLNAVNLRQG